MGRKSKSDSSFKHKVVIEALKETSTLPELAKKYGVAPAIIIEWKKTFLEKSKNIFDETVSQDKEFKKVVSERDRLLKKVGQLTLEVDFFAEAYETYCVKKK